MLHKALNAQLPKSIRVLAVQDVPDAFHARCVGVLGGGLWGVLWDVCVNEWCEWVGGVCVCVISNPSQNTTQSCATGIVQ